KLRGQAVRRRSVDRENDERRRHYLDEGGRRLPAVRRGRDRQAGLYDEDRGEAQHPDLAACEYRAAVREGLAYAVRRDRARPEESTGEGRGVLPDRRVPVHGGPGQEVVGQ